MKTKVVGSLFILLFSISATVIAQENVAALVPASVENEVPSLEVAKERFHALSEKLQNFSTMQADFRQEVTTASFPRPRVETGTLSALNPGRLRWDYRTPEEKLAISDGQFTWFYMPLDRVVYKQPVPENAADLPTLVLAGRGSLHELFSILVLPSPPGLLRLELLGIEKVILPWNRLVLTMDPAALEVLVVEMYEETGVHTSYEFTHTRWNEALPEDLFAFTPPKGVRVVLPEPVAPDSDSLESDKPDTDK